MSHSPRISAIVCTYNRCAFLSQALESLAAQSLDKSLFEVVVVDNASTDETPSVVAACQKRFPDCAIRLIREERQGLSHARNTGFGASRGEFVAYLDDDAIAAREWLEAGVAAFETNRIRPRIVVGPVIPRYPEGKPRWFNDRFETYHLGDSPTELTGNQSFMGGNAMFEKCTLETLGGFNPRLGMTGNRLWLGEELELLVRMRQEFGEGCRVYYDPRILIEHAIPRQKLRVGYVLRRRYLNGQCKSLMDLENGVTSRARQAMRSVAWMGWLAFSAVVFAYRYRSVRSWLTERGAPIAVQLGQLTATLRGGSDRRLVGTFGKEELLGSPAARKAA